MINYKAMISNRSNQIKEETMLEKKSKRTLIQIRKELDVLVAKAKTLGTYSLEGEDKELWRKLRNEEEAIISNKKRVAKEKAATNKEFVAIFEEADTEGLKAGTEITPRPMVVEAHADMLDDNSPVVYSECVNEGLCGFAWVIVESNCAFSRWLKAMELGTYDSYYSGTMVYCHHFNQSVERKEKWAHKFVEVLNKYGIKAYGQSRLD